MHHWKILAAALRDMRGGRRRVRVGAVRARGRRGRSRPTRPPPETVVDRIVATVEDRAILQSEVDNEIKRLPSSRRSARPFRADEEKALRQEVLNSLVADALLAIQAERDNLKVEDKEVDAAVERCDRGEEDGDRGGRRVRRGSSRRRGSRSTRCAR